MKMALAAAFAVGIALTGPAFAQVTQSGSVTTFTPAGSLSSAGAVKLDYEHAKPVPMPSISGSGVSPTSAQAKPNLTGKSGFSPGSEGSGAQQHAIQLFAPHPDSAPVSPQSGAAPQEYGSNLQQYTTSRANLYNEPSASYYPYRAAGKLFFQEPGGTYVCSASMITKGVIVTAAHCVANFGKSQFYSNWQFVPGYNNGTAPYGIWYSKSAAVLTSYANGTDACYQTGVICQDDVALIDLYVQNGTHLGDIVGWYGYGYGDFGYSNGTALLTQLGYPVALDSGGFMERTDSQGFHSSLQNNTIIGSLMTGGSSGGPWIENFGRPPLLNGVSYGNAADHNIVVGVTSWGYTNSAIKQQGAAPFTYGNIQTLINYVCGADPGHC